MVFLERLAAAGLVEMSAEDLDRLKSGEEMVPAGADFVRCKCLLVDEVAEWGVLPR